MCGPTALDWASPLASVRVGDDVLTSNCRLPQSAPFLAQQASSITLPINYLRSFEKRILGEATSIGTSKNPTLYPSLFTINKPLHKMAEDPECTTREMCAVSVCARYRYLLISIKRALPVFIDINKEGATGISIYLYQ